MAILTLPLVAAALAAAPSAANTTPLPAILAATPIVQAPGQDSPAMPECTGDEVVLPSGLRYCVLKEGGDAEYATFGDRVKVHYTGWNLDGTSFDSSRKARFPGAPVEPTIFAIGQVVPGWNEALELMSPGDHWRIYLPSALAYGEAGRPPQIQPNADLIFEIEMIEITARAPKFIAWDADAEGITTLENGVMYRVLEAGEGISAKEADIAMLEFGAFNPAGGLAFAHTMTRSGSAMPIKPGRPALPFMGELLGLMKTGAKLHVNVPSTLGIGTNGQVPNLPEGSNEIWVLEVGSVNKFVRPEFVLPPESELTTTPSGLKYKLVKPGTGRAPKASNSVLAHYTGWFTDGKSFDSSFNGGQPISFPLGGVVPGWTEGLQLVKEGGEIILVIPSDLGYGDDGRGDIPGGATLVFNVQLVAVQ